MVGKYTLKASKLPKFYRWGGGGLPFTWSFGWVTGLDNDLMCVVPNAQTRLQEHIALSPICSNRLLALCAFVIKAILVRVDHNLKGLELAYGMVPNREFRN